MLLSFAAPLCNPVGKDRCIFKEEYGLLPLKVFIPSEVICQHYFPVCLLTMSKTGKIGNQITQITNGLSLKFQTFFPRLSLLCYRYKQWSPSSLIHLCVSFPLCMWAEKTDSPGESQLQLAFISSQPVGYGPQTVDFLHMVFSPSLAVSSLSARIKLIRADLGILLSTRFLWREWDSGHRCVSVPVVYLMIKGKQTGLMEICKLSSEGDPLNL